MGDEKAMFRPITQNRKTILAATPIVLILVIALVVPAAYASTELTIPNDKFNSSTMSFYYADKEYKIEDGGYEIKITNSLTYNSVVPDAKAVIRIAPSTSEGTNVIDIVMFGNGALDINYKGSKIYGGTWNSGEALKVQCQPAENNKMKLIVYSGSQRLTSQTLDTRIDLLVIGASGIDPYDADGDTNVDTPVTGGSVTVAITGLISFAPITNLILAIVPVVVLVGVVNVVVRMIKGVSGK